MYRDTPSGPLLVTAFNGFVVALEAATGRIAWQREHRGTRLHVTENRVIVGGASLGIFDYATGAVIAQMDLAVSTLLVAHDRVYVSSSGALACVQLATGALLWKNQLPGTGYGHAALGVPGHAAQADFS